MNSRKQLGRIFQGCTLVFIIAAGLVLAMFMTPYVARGDEASTWMKLLSGCSGDPSTIGNVAQVYFGPSNSAGPGSVFKVDGHRQYSLRFDLQDLLNDYNLAPPSPTGAATEDHWFSVGHPAQCQATNSVQWNVRGSIPIQGPLGSGISADVQGSLAKASSVKLRTDGYRLIYLKTDAFARELADPKNAFYLEEFRATKDRVIEANALQVLGVSVDYTFSTDIAASVKASLPIGPVTTGPDGINVTAKFVNDTTYEISTKSDFYLMGSYVTWPELASGTGILTGRSGILLSGPAYIIRSPHGPKLVRNSLTRPVKIANKHIHRRPRK